MTWVPLALVLALVPADELRRHYTIEKGPDAILTLGGKAVLALRILARDDGYVHPDAPLRIKLSAEGAVEVERSALTRADAIDPRPGERARELAWKIPVAAGRTAGPGVVSGELSFYLCSHEWCRQVREPLRWGALVKP